VNPTAVALILTSCTMHAGWNLMVRGQAGAERMRFVARMLLVAVAAGLGPAAVSEVLTRSLTATAWLCVAGSGVFCGAYYYALARAYGSSDFTVVYPVARSLPVLLIASADVLRGRMPSPAGWAGMVLVVGGCFLAPLHSFGDVRLRRYLNRSVAWMVLTAMGTVGYTLLDKLASEQVAPGAATAARYAYFFFLGSYVTYVALVKLLPVRRDRPARPIGWRPAAVAALLNFGAYWLVLWAYQLARRASYVVALRQFSIVLGVVAALAIFREKGPLVRLAAALLIAAGLVLIGVWGG
jgi:drug/metabolite transporter (DMT)-like permease